MRRPLQWYDTISINIYFTGLTTISQTMTPLVVPLLVQQFVGIQEQGRYYGQIRLWSLMMALIVQAFMGIMSDRSTLPWGRRRPFIFIGTLFALLFMMLIGFSAGLDGISGYWFLFLMVLMLMVSSNTSQAATQALIPDLVPEDKRGLFSGVKSLFEVPIPLILVAFTIGRLIASGNYWGGILLAMGILTFTMLVTMFIPETPQGGPPVPVNWSPFIRLFFMTIAFTAIILSLGYIANFLAQTIAIGDHILDVLIPVGVIGLFVMTIVIAIGVYVSIRISLGKAAGKNPSYTWWVINRLAFLVGMTNIASFAVFFLQGRLGLEREQAAGPASQLLMVVGFFILILAIPSGRLADRYGHKLLVAISGLVSALGTIIIILAPNLAVIYVGAILLGAGAGTFYTSNWALGTVLVPPDEAGRYLGISNLAGAGAGAIGAYIGGPLADYVTTQLPDLPGMGYVVLFSIYGILLFFSVVAISQVHTQQEEKV